MQPEAIKLKRRQFSCAAGLLVCFACWSARSIEPSDIANLSLEELSQVKVNIASVADKPVREQPAIVSVITADEIKATGARDLMDVLSQVPGFSFGEDVSTLAGTGFRGFWAYEGKMLVLLDGIPVNEGFYGNVLMGHHYSADQIKQVEIIRGPGSARYGGNAELAVISITTKGAEQDGGFVSVRPEAVPGRIGTSVDGNIGYTFTNDWRLDIGVSYENFIRSDQNYVSEDGTVVNMRRDSGVEDFLLNANLGWKDLDLRLIYDNYEIKNPLSYGEPPPNYAQWSRSFRSLTGSAKYDFHLNDAITLSPKFTVENQDPWASVNPPQGNRKIEYDKYNLEVPCVVDFNDNNHLLVGVDGYVETAQAIDTSYYGVSPSVYFNGSDHLTYNDIAGYAQYDLDTQWANFSVGGRYESHSYGCSAFVPRLSVTRAWEKFHLKLLYDQAFRTPNIGDISYHVPNQSITDEKTSSYQLEAGYEFNRHWSAVANLYYIRIENTLAYISGTPSGEENGGPVSNHGGEFQLRYANTRFAGTLGYAYYRADEQLNGTTLGLYGSSVSGLNLALPAHTVSASGTCHLTEKLDWNLNGTLGSATRVWANNGANVAAEQWQSAQFNLNTFVNYRWKALDLGAGIQNLLDEHLKLGQAYNGGAAPLPLLGRTFSCA